MAVARIVLGITGGIAAYKACEVLRLLVRAGHDVQPLPTAAAQRFVAAETFHALARRSSPSGPYPHLLTADLLVVAPLTAHTLARLAHGLADDVLTEAALAHRGPLLLAPAMNTRMWEHPATQQNLALMRERGARVVGPAEGELAEGEVGMGRMAEPAEVAEHALALLQPPAGPLARRRVLVTAGGTREPLDAVRFVGNRSSGRMGVALAAAAARRGAQVTLLAANLAVAPPAAVEVVQAPTAAALARETLARSDAEVVLMAAAVADYEPAQPLASKRRKDGEPWHVELVPTLDIVCELGARRFGGQVLVAFGAEHGADGLERKRRMLVEKNVDLVVYNDVAVGFDGTDNEVTMVTADRDTHVPRASKSHIAEAVLDEVERLLGER